MIRIFSPAYRHQVDVRHAQFIAGLLVSLRGRGVPVEWDAGHSSTLARLRADALASALAVPAARLFVSVDSDVWIQPSRAWEFANVLHGAWQGHASSLDGFDYVGVICPQDDGHVNAFDSAKVRLETLPELGDIAPVHAIGSGLTVSRLSWYREHARDTGALYALCATRTGDAIAGDPSAWLGEDIWHCEVIRRRGARIGGWHAGAVHAAVRA